MSFLSYSEETTGGGGNRDRFKDFQIVKKFYSLWVSVTA